MSEITSDTQRALAVGDQMAEFRRTLVIAALDRYLDLRGFVGATTYKDGRQYDFELQGLMNGKSVKVFGDITGDEFLRYANYSESDDLIIIVDCELLHPTTSRRKDPNADVLVLPAPYEEIVSRTSVYLLHDDALWSRSEQLKGWERMIP